VGVRDTSDEQRATNLGDEKIRRRGFTLIELLIVVTVIIILSSLAFVNFLQVRERAKRAAANSFIAQLEADTNTLVIKIKVLQLTSLST